MIIPAMFSTSGGPGLSTIRIHTGPYIIKFLECIYIQQPEKFGDTTIQTIYWEKNKVKFSPQESREEKEYHVSNREGLSHYLRVFIKIMPC